MRYPLVLLLLCVLCLCAYAGSLSNAFIFDDHFLIVNNRYIKSAFFIPQLFQEDVFVSHAWAAPSPRFRYYRPLQALSYAIERMVWGFSPARMRAVNVFIHALCGALIYCALFFVFKDPLLALLSAALFCTHPIHVSTVALISVRSVLLAALFMLASLYLFLRFLSGGRWIFYAASLAGFVAAVLSREDALLTPLFLSACVLFYAGSKRRAVAWIMPFILMAASYWVFRLYFLPCGQMAAGNLFSLQAIRSFFYSLFDYCGQLILPVTARELIMPQGRLLDRAAFAAALLFFAGTFLAGVRRREKIILFGLLWYAIGLAPLAGLTEGVRLFGPIISEHYVYIASAGFVLILAYFLLRLRTRMPGACLALSVLLLTVSSFTSGLFTRYYKDDITFYRYLLRMGKGSSFFRVNLATSYYQEGAYGQAADQARLALEEDADSWEAYLVLGNVYKDTGEQEKALEMYEKAASLRPAAVVFNNMALIYKYRGEEDEALRFFSKALESDPGSLLVMGNLAAFFIDNGEFQKALALTRRMSAFDPQDAAALVLRGIASAHVGDQAAAQAAFEEALRIDPLDIDALRNLGVLYANKQDYQEAQKLWNRVLELKPGERETMRLLEMLKGTER